MSSFYYKENDLYCEDAAVSDIIGKSGSPCFIYSASEFRERFDSMRSAFSGTEPLICYSVKGCSNLSILKLLAGKGSGADIVSGGELFRTLKAGIPPEKTVYAGVGKRDDEIEYAIDSGILLFNAESMEEAERINEIAGRKGVRAPLSFRVNPDIDAETHAYTTTAKKDKKFGIPILNAPEFFAKASSMENVDVKGVDCHLGSPIYKTDPYLKAAKKLTALCDNLREQGINLEYIDMGGGVAIVYENENPFKPADLAEILTPFFKSRSEKLILEPGRYISGNSGILAGTIVYKKKTAVKTFLITDFSMNELIRPPFYGSYHGIVPVHKRNEGKETVDVVGPVCESSDFSAIDREAEIMRQGDLITAQSAGAYCFSMSSNYNSRTRPAEVLVDGSSFRTIRSRETYEDLIRGENV
ncbi:MAG: diaminopimelate decarboxylase [Fibrobacterota bacterium]